MLPISRVSALPRPYSHKHASTKKAQDLPGMQKLSPRASQKPREVYRPERGSRVFLCGFVKSQTINRQSLHFIGRYSTARDSPPLLRTKTRMSTTASPCLRIKDYRGLIQLTPEQEQQLAAAKAAAAASSPAQPEQQLRAPAAKLNSGYEIPMVGLGTW